MQSVEEAELHLDVLLRRGKKRRLGADHMGAPATKFIAFTTCQ